MATALPQPQPAPQPAQQPLPQAVPLPVASAKPPTPAQVLVPAGLYLGHGVMPLPQRLLTKILNLEFVEMQDLLPEAWLALTDDDSVKCCATSAAGGRKRRPPVTNIFTWLQGFASLASALSTKYPAMVPEFLAYQSTIRPLQINFLFPVLETTNVVCGRAVNSIIYTVARPTGNT